jgi:hypothetical protein
MSYCLYTPAPIVYQAHGAQAIPASGWHGPTLLA